MNDAPRPRKTRARLEKEREALALQNAALIAENDRLRRRLGERQETEASIIARFGHWPTKAEIKALASAQWRHEKAVERGRLGGHAKAANRQQPDS